MTWCKVCERYRDNVNAAVGGLQWARVQRDPDAIKAAEERLADHRTGWERHRADTGCAV
ncbi:hypothetical protein QZH56_11785 [Streptomyces olivoreticuli]|uniref:hypothetical protein n=1 Tax=Streptomyces olivoreticuli TaxID=68246 RepID=UPI0026583281|nr:hypothetical protein [Streptomyces olivoreticuli]WKK21010.1 hypothetical protein QZH56_19195 [Streptomyces olivoreticuli]WKK26207.1 hypothetical protein QZH56_11785 [Streptomyces olivoreticuli]